MVFGITVKVVIALQVNKKKILLLRTRPTRW